MRVTNEQSSNIFQTRETNKEVITIKNKRLMRKSNLVLLAAAASMLASCSNEKLLSDNQDAQQVIGFTSYSESSTRGDVNDKKNLEYYHSTFAVFGTKVNKNDATKFQYVFGGKPVTGTLNPAGVTCTYQTTADAVLEDWKYDNPRFWDKQANYKFIAYAPVSNDNPINYYYNAADALVGATGNGFKTKQDYILKGTNLQATATEAEKVKGFNVDGEDLDLMISALNSQDGASHSPKVNLLFRHILSKLNVKVAKSEALQNCTVTIKEIKITGLKDNGSYNESSYVNNELSKVSGWTASYSVTPSTYKLSYSSSDGQVLNNGTYSGEAPDVVFTAGKPFFFIESLVMPQDIADDQVKLTIDYTIQSGDYIEEYPYELDLYDIAALQKFFDGYNYTLNFTIDPDVIIFDAEVSTWDDINVNRNIGKDD